MTSSNSGNEVFWILFLVCVAIASTLIGLLMHDMTLVFTGVAVIMLTLVLVLGMAERDHAKIIKQMRTYLP